MSRIVSEERVGRSRYNGRSASDRRQSLVTKPYIKRYVPPAQAVPLPHKLRTFRCGDVLCLVLYHYLCQTPVKLSALRLRLRTMVAKHIDDVQKGRVETCSCLRIVEALQTTPMVQQVCVERVTIADMLTIKAAVA